VFCFLFGELRLSPTTTCKAIYASSSALCLIKSASNKASIHTMHFASEEGGELKIHSLSPQRQMAREQGERRVAEGRGGAGRQRARRRSAGGRRAEGRSIP
jgi:hypothetical protein